MSPDCVRTPGGSQEIFRDSTQEPSSFAAAAAAAAEPFIACDLESERVSGGSGANGFYDFLTHLQERHLALLELPWKCRKLTLWQSAVRFCYTLPKKEAARESLREEIEKRWAVRGRKFM